MILKTIENSDLRNVALIHQKAYNNEHFSSLFSLKMLEKYYSKIVIFTNYNFIIYDENKTTPLGFIIGGKEINKPINEFIKENILYLFFYLLKNPRFIVEKAKGIVYKLRGIEEEKSTTEIILLSIAVSTGQQKMGVGKTLVSTFEEALKKDNINRYGLSVRKVNNKAIRFYENLGFNIEFETDKSIYYTKEI